MSVGDLGPEKVVTADPDTELKEIAEKLESETVGSIIITEDDKPIGIVTDRDVAIAVHRHDDVGSVPASDVMAEDPATISEDDDAMAISRAIEEHNVRRFPVVNSDGKLTGIVTLDDLVATIGEQLDHVSDTVESQSPDYNP